jgi:hypothetical protein
MNSSSLLRVCFSWPSSVDWAWLELSIYIVGNRGSWSCEVEFRWILEICKLQISNSLFFDHPMSIWHATDTCVDTKRHNDNNHTLTHVHQRVTLSWHSYISVIVCQNFLSIANKIFPYSKTSVIFLSIHASVACRTDIGSCLHRISYTLKTKCAYIK